MSLFAKFFIVFAATFSISGDYYLKPVQWVSFWWVAE